MNDDLPSLGGETPLSTALTEGKQIGYEGFELGKKFPRELQALKTLFAQYGLSLVSGWYSGRLAERSVEEETEAVGPHLDLLAKNGATVMVYGEVANSIQGAPQPLYQRPRFFSDAQWNRYCRASEPLRGIHALARHARELSYHMGAYVDACRRRSTDVADQRSRRPAVRCGPHHLRGRRALNVLQRHIARVCHVYYKDVRPEIVKLAHNCNWSFLGAVINGAFSVPCDGCVDYPGIIACLAEHGYSGWLVVEAEQDPVIAPSYEYADKGYRTLRALVDGTFKEAA